MASQSGVLAEGTPSVFCKLCPHEAYCEDAYYAVDISKKGFDDHDNTQRDYNDRKNKFDHAFSVLSSALSHAPSH